MVSTWGLWVSWKASYKSKPSLLQNNKELHLWLQRKKTVPNISVCALKSLPRVTEHVNLSASDLLITDRLHKTQILIANVRENIKQTKNRNDN